MASVYRETASPTNKLKDFNIRLNIKPTTPPQKMNRMHWHSYYEILYLYDDNTELSIAGKSYKLDKGSIVFITPYVVHDTLNLNNHDNKEIVCHFSENFINSIFYDKDFFHLLTTNLFLKEPFFINIHNKIARESLFSLLEYYPQKTNSHQSYMLLQGFIFILFNAIFENINYLPVTSSSETAFSLTEIYEYLKNKIDKHKPISLEDISKKFNYDPSYFSKKFKANFGISFKDYVISLKIQEGQKLLQTTDFSIAHIAKLLNYQNTQNFCRAYKDILGITPYQYKKDMEKSTHRK